MSNFLSVAVVTGTLQLVLQVALEAEPSPNDFGGVSVTSARPGSAEVPKVGVNVFLYEAVPNAAFRNADTPTRDARGALVQRPRAALNLRYLLTFHGADKTLEPQRLMGATVRTLHGSPVLTPAQIDATRSNPAFAFVKDSNLSDEVERVKLTWLTLSFDELSRIWSVFPTTDYALSMAYEASVVFIEGSSAPRATQPVSRSTVTALVTGPIAIDAVSAEGGGPILASSTLVLGGRGLLADVVGVRVAGAEVPPASVRPTIATLALPDVAAAPGATLAAGVQGVQIAHPLLLGDPLVPHAGLESNVAAFVLHPVVATKPDTTPDVTVAGATTAGDGTRGATVTIALLPSVQPGQRVRLFLDALPPAPGQAARYAFDLPVPAAVTAAPSFEVAGVAPGTYVPRVSVDGGETLPTRDAVTGLADGPLVTL